MSHSDKKKRKTSGTDEPKKKTKKQIRQQQEQLDQDGTEKGEENAILPQGIQHDNQRTTIAPHVTHDNTEHPQPPQLCDKALERRRKKQEKKAKKQALLQQIPTKDEHGISYTKIQIRRMMHRVQRGLHPIPTEEEEREMARQKKQEKKMEEEELLGLIFDRNTDSNDKENSSDEDLDHPEEEEYDDVPAQDNNLNHSNDDSKDDSWITNQEEGKMGKKKTSQGKQRSKIVPPDYVCQACQNKHTPLHWIYDCPDKIHRPGCNQISKKDRGFHDPSSRKVFVSGLPFDFKSKDVERIFENCGVVSNCKLLIFQDSKRCKGQAFVTFETDQGAKNALKLNGSVLPSANTKNSKEQDTTKELKLKISKMLSRKVTKAA